MMKYFFTSLFITYVLLGYSQQPTLDWANNYGTQTEDLDSYGRAITVDNIGNIYSCGTIEGNVDFDPGSGNYLISSSNNLFVQKTNENGNLNWVAVFEGSHATPKDIKTDLNGNIYITGFFFGVIDFDPGPNVVNKDGGNQRALFILKLNNDGSLNWVRTVKNDESIEGNALAVDQFENVYITGEFRDTADFNPGPGVYNLNGYNNTFVDDGFVLKLDNNGDFVWAYQFGSPYGDKGNDITIDNDGNVLVAGYFKDSVDFDPGPGSAVLETDYSNGFIQKIDPNANFIWVKQVGNDSIYVECNSIEIDNDNNIYISGEFIGDSLSFDEWNAGEYIVSYGSGESYIAKFSSNGNYVWANSIGGPYVDHSSKLKVFNNKLYASGVLDNYGYFTLHDTSFFINAAGVSDDFYYLKLDTNGGFDWIEVFGDNQSEAIEDITIDYNESVIGIGHFWSPFDFDPTSLNYFLSPGLGRDLFIQKLSQCSDITYDSINSCGSYTWINGITYNTDISNASYKLSNTAGCDSIIFLNLDIQTTYGIDTVEACSPYTWIDGNDYYQDDSISTFTLTNVNGCDSIVTLKLTILSDSIIDNQYACDSLVWIDGNTYYSDNNSAFHTYTNTSGCDSTVYLNLDINSNTSSSTQSVVACDSYNWIDGNTYTSNNSSATHILPNIYGCDSVVTLDLTINNSYSSTEFIQTCNIVYSWNGQVYDAENNTGSITYTASNGCDSTLNLVLTVNGDRIIDSISACNSFTWIDGNTYTSDKNELDNITMIFTNSNGCDSTHKLILDITKIDTNISVFGFDLVSNELDGDSYSWLNCSDSYNTVGHYFDDYTPSDNNYYAVKMTKGDCIDTSICISIANNVFVQEFLDQNISIAPNPTNNQFSIINETNTNIDYIEIYSSTGQLVRTIQNSNYPIDLSQFERGVYWIKIYVQEAVINKKLVLIE